jgi:5-(carboxyamino)imidazole ribonucleotide mutase
MPAPIPVAVVGLDNAAYLACEILALKYPEMKEKLAAFRAKMKAGFEQEYAQNTGGEEL